LNNMIERVNKLSKTSLIISGLILVLIIGIFDFMAGPQIGFSFFYLLPIYLVAWFGGRRSGVVISFVSAIVWFVTTELISAKLSPFLFISLWNAFVRLAFFLVIVFLETALKDALSRATTDPLTSIGNRRYFFEAAELEIKKLSRYKRPFTAAYIDIDNFKAINDNFGHDAGDRLLKAAAQIVKKNIRFTDIFARLGGDEFILLLPETDTETARGLIPKLHELLVQEAKKNKGLASFSVGVVTFIEPPGSVDEMIKKIDSVMYSAKKSGNNLIRYETFDR
jgi:diguanylate cyclase (GGDEF)-like protein